MEKLLVKINFGLKIFIIMFLYAAFLFWPSIYENKYITVRIYSKFDLLHF